MLKRILIQPLIVVSTIAATTAVLIASGVLTSSFHHEKVSTTCATNHTSLTTDLSEYTAGNVVMMKFQYFNSTNRSCAVDTGPSIGFTISNEKGQLVWDQCMVNDRPGACPLFIDATSVAPGRDLVLRATWDAKVIGPKGQLMRAPLGHYKVHYGNSLLVAWLSLIA